MRGTFLKETHCMWTEIRQNQKDLIVTHFQPFAAQVSYLSYLLPLSFLLADKDTGAIKQSKPSKLSRQAWRSQRVRPAPAQQSREDSQDRRHPFALYGSGEKDADTAGRKTHNVCPAASTHEVTSVWPSTDLHKHLSEALTVMFLSPLDPWVCFTC